MRLTRHGTVIHSDQESLSDPMITIYHPFKNKFLPKNPATNGINPHPRH